MRAPLRFFAVVRPWHPVVGAGLLVTTIVAGLLLAAGRVTADKALAPVFVLQALAASSGFAGPARRGHYDVLIASGQRRLWIGLAHWASSAVPGLASWLAIATIERAASTGTVLSVMPGTLVGLFVVSALPWAATVPLPRLTAGLVWIVLLVTAIAVAPDQSAARPLAVFVCPWVLVGDPLRGSPYLLPAATLFVVSACAVAAALSWIHRVDLPLEAAQ